MAKLDMKSVTKYLGLGAGAVGVPALLANVGQVSSMLANIPFWNQALIQGITVGGIVLASAGVGMVDTLFFGK